MTQIQSMAASDPLALSSVKIKDLKTLIETGALEHKDCLDRADLERRASEAVAQTCAFVATLDLRRLEVAAKVWDARRKQDSDYESDCSDESGPPSLDTGLDDDDDGPPGLEEDGAAPPGGSAGGSAGGSDSEDSDYDSDDSDDSGPPGLEDEEERERAERAARKKAAAAPAPAPAPPLSKSQAKAAKAKRQKVRARRPVSNSRVVTSRRWRHWVYTIEPSLPTQMRKQAAFADTLKKGSKVFVTRKGVETICSVVKIHRDDPEELYVTVKEASGQERQTLLSYCREAKGAKAAKAERAARVKAAADAAEQKLRDEEEQEREGLCAPYR